MPPSHYRAPGCPVDCTCWAGIHHCPILCRPLVGPALRGRLSGCCFLLTLDISYSLFSDLFALRFARVPRQNREKCTSTRVRIFRLSLHNRRPQREQAASKDRLTVDWYKAEGTIRRLPQTPNCIEGGGRSRGDIRYRQETWLSSYTLVTTRSVVRILENRKSIA